MNKSNKAVLLVITAMGAVATILSTLGLIPLN